MTDVAIALTKERGTRAGEELATSISERLGGGSLDALIVFATPDQDHVALLEELVARCDPGTLVGCSSAGEFSSEESGVGMTCAVAISAPEMQFTAALGRGPGDDVGAAAEAIAAGFEGLKAPGFRYYSALVLTDALAGFADDLVDRLSVLTGGVYRFFGGGAGDDARFQKTVVFCGTEVTDNAAVALEILSNKPIGIGVRHGWQPGGERMRVTAAEGMQLRSLNAVPALEVFEGHAADTGQLLDPKEPIPFFLHNVLGVESPDGYRLRVPLAFQEDGSVACAAEVPRHSTACIMTTTPASAAEAAAAATRAALEQMDGNEAAVALVFDCVATRLRLGQEFGAELAAVQAELGDVPMAGFNTYGQIAQADGQFSGFHNCTAVVCTLPK
ncbi:MAG TPA: FIST N-terminal domain-containing protein [Longimicrobiaceae bacterium]|nr:FIST N-terminal domain-containing protein [Longimicrobiaceae bacterium]